MLDLQIFEVRYLDMIAKCHKSGTPFGVVALRKGSEVRRVEAAATGAEGFAPSTLPMWARWPPSPNSLHRKRACWWCAAMAVRASHSNAQPAQVRLVGGRCGHLGLRPRHPVPPDLLPLADALARVLEQQRMHGGPNAGAAAPYHLDDCGWVANRWCDLLAMPLPQKRSLDATRQPLAAPGAGGRHAGQARPGGWSLAPAAHVDDGAGGASSMRC